MEILLISPQETTELLNDGKMTEIRGIKLEPNAIGPEEVLASSLERWNNGEDWLWCGERLFYAKDRQKVIGAGCFKNSPKNRSVEIGYGIAEEWQGYGYATIAVQLMLEEAFQYDEIDSVSAESSVNNPASIRVLEKNGFIRCGQRYDEEDGLLDCWIKKQH